MLPHASIAVGSLLGRRNDSLLLENVCTTLASTERNRTQTASSNSDITIATHRIVASLTADDQEIDLRT